MILIQIVCTIHCRIQPCWDGVEVYVDRVGSAHRIFTKCVILIQIVCTIHCKALPPCTHIILFLMFMRSVITTLWWTSYIRWNNVVCVQRYRGTFCDNGGVDFILKIRIFIQLKTTLDKVICAGMIEEIYLLIQRYLLIWTYLIRRYLVWRSCNLRDFKWNLYGACCL